MRTISILLLSITILATSCINDKGFKVAYDSINQADLADYVSNLGSDEFMGRAPFTEGEKITVEYLAVELEKIGFEPAFGESYLQEVPMVKIQSALNRTVTIASVNRDFSLTWPDKIAVTSPKVKEKTRIEASDMVFAGFGITAPEYDWDDFKNIDVEGKTIVVLVNDPGLYTGDNTLFKGREMTYYGRWNYKFAEAARRGAKGILIVHETLGAGYSYDIPRNSCMTPNLFMTTEDTNMELCDFTGWIEEEAARELFSDIGYDIDELRMSACKRDFTGFNMETNISLEIDNSFEYNSSTNVAGILKGSKAPDEVIIYSGHWDHFGIGEVQNGDSIFNGAVDNGNTMAMMFEIGQAFTMLDKNPDRSVMLFFPTAEEQGLLGSTYYTEFPAIPLEKTVANINNDLVLPIGRMKDVMVTGYGQSDLDDILAEAARKQDRYLLPDPNPHTGMYFRSDHFPFALKGVPALFARGNCDSREFGEEWAALQEKDYIDNKYHKAADNYEPESWNLEGMIEDAQLTFEVGYKLANSDIWPEWKDGSEFKGIMVR